MLTLTHQFFLDISDALKAEANKHGYDVVVVSGEFDVARQDKQVKDFLVRKRRRHRAVPVRLQGDRPGHSGGQRRRRAGVHRRHRLPGPGPKVVTHIATDNYSGGKQAGPGHDRGPGTLPAARSPSSTIKTAESCILRVKGFKEVIDAHNRTAGQSARSRSSPNCPAAAPRTRATRPPRTCCRPTPTWRASSPSTTPPPGRRAALEKAGRTERIKIIGFDGQPEGKQAIKDGKIYADPIQFPSESAGHATANAIVRYFEGEEVPAEVLIPTGLYRQADAIKDSGGVNAFQGASKCISGGLNVFQEVRNAFRRMTAGA